MPKINIIEQLTSLRKERGYSQRELAERSGISHIHIAKIERGNSSPTIDTLSKIVDALGAEIIIKHS